MLASRVANQVGLKMFSQNIRRQTPYIITRMNSNTTTPQKTLSADEKVELCKKHLKSSLFATTVLGASFATATSGILMLDGISPILITPAGITLYAVCDYIIQNDVLKKL